MNSAGTMAAHLRTDHEGTACGHVYAFLHHKIVAFVDATLKNSVVDLKQACLTL